MAPLAVLRAVNAREDEYGSLRVVLLGLLSELAGEDAALRLSLALDDAEAARLVRAWAHPLGHDGTAKARLAKDPMLMRYLRVLAPRGGDAGREAASALARLDPKRGVALPDALPTAVASALRLKDALGVDDAFVRLVRAKGRRAAGRAPLGELRAHVAELRPWIAPASEESKLRKQLAAFFATPKTTTSTTIPHATTPVGTRRPLRWYPSARLETAISWCSTPA